ncbi:MAG: LolA family protein [Thermodesulfobacteriota bacterium]
MDWNRQWDRFLVYVAWVLVLAVLMLAGAGSAFAEDKDASELPQRIQSQYEQLQGLKTDFVQELTNAASGEKQRREGTISFAKPRHIRWETTTPESEMLIVGPETVWDYFAEEEVVYTYSTDEVFQSKTMLRFISGEANITDDFHIESQESENEWVKLKLIPKKPESNMVLAYIWVEPETALLRQVLLVDFGGNGNKLTFTDIQLNPEFEEGWFHFEPPEGVDVMRNTPPGQDGEAFGGMQQ